LVTNHESFGYYADRYGFEIVGSVLPSFDTYASPSAHVMARLVEAVRAAHVRAIFLETGNNPQLARAVAQETGITIITELYTHSTTGPDGPAPTYVDMLKYNTRTIVEVLK
jgi:ABC-type Zn uptake system ZnuABC Zn-binding protein ZnuA